MSRVMTTHDQIWAQTTWAVERAVGTEAMGQACAEWGRAYAARRGAAWFRVWYRPPVVRLGRFIVRGRRRRVA